MNINDTIVILGSYGLAKEFYFYIKRSKPHIKNFIFVNDLEDGQTELNLNGCKYHVEKNWNFDKKFYFVVAVGNPVIKKILVNKALSIGLKPIKTIVDIYATVLDENCSLGVGGLIAPGCILTTNIKLGNYVTLNLNTTVGHDTVIGDFCTTNPGVHISGEILIGTGNEFGTGSILRDRIKIGSNKKIGAQAAVVKDILSDKAETFIGVPVYLLEKKNND
jgi:sugar O-acyltransferase (sialic acid O-acetyltransferase NeuD family)